MAPLYVHDAGRRPAFAFLRDPQRAAVFNINTGVVTAYKEARDGSEHIVAFLLADDLFGLSEEGRYANSTKAITAVSAYRLPVTALRNRLSKDALAKATHYTLRHVVGCSV